MNGRNGLIVIDTTSNKIIDRFTVAPDKKRFFLNIAVDAKNSRAFITDPDLPNVLVVDIGNGNVLSKIDVINSWPLFITRSVRRFILPIATPN